MPETGKSQPKDIWLSEHLTLRDVRPIEAKFWETASKEQRTDGMTGKHLQAYFYERGYQEGYTTRTEGK